MSKRVEWRSATLDNAPAVAWLLNTLSPDKILDVKIVVREDEFVVFYHEAVSTPFHEPPR